MPKVAHFIDSHDPGGAETIVIEICRKIDKSGYTPAVFHFGNAWLEEKCQKYGIPSLFVPGHRLFKSSTTIPLFSVGFARFLRSQHVDILHSHLFGAVTGACFATYFARIPHIGTLHDIYTIEEKKKRIRYIQLSSFLGTRLVTVSRQMNRYLSDLGRFHSGTLQTIANGVDIDRFDVSVSRDQYPDLDLSPKDFVFICIGRLEKIKGHDVLVKAFGKMKSMHGVKLLFVGDGPVREEIENHVSEQGLQHVVRMLGHRNDVPELLKLSDCFVLSSRSEGLSCSIIEAMAAGLPVVATDVGGNSELVTDEVNGYLVPSESPDILSTRLQIMINDASKRQKFAEMSLNRAREHYSLDSMMEKYLDNYNLMIENSRRKIKH